MVLRALGALSTKYKSGPHIGVGGLYGGFAHPVTYGRKNSTTVANIGKIAETPTIVGLQGVQSVARKRVRKTKQSISKKPKTVDTKKKVRKIWTLTMMIGKQVRNKIL